jgi:hypothetical protein
MTQKERQKKYYQTHIEKIKEYRKNHQERTKNYFLNKNYNMSLRDKEVLLISQNNKCGICEKEFTGFRPFVPCVDHVHDVSKKIRGLLCMNCNMGIGLLQDNPVIIENAIKWIEKGTDNENN